MNRPLRVWPLAAVPAAVTKIVRPCRYRQGHGYPKRGTAFRKASRLPALLYTSLRILRIDADTNHAVPLRFPVTNGCEFRIITARNVIAVLNRPICQYLPIAPRRQSMSSVNETYRATTRPRPCVFHASNYALNRVVDIVPSTTRLDSLLIFYSPGNNTLSLRDE